MTLAQHGHHRSTITLTFLAAMLATARLAACQESVEVSGASLVTAGLIRHHVNVIADDSMQGRETPGPGLERAARYAAGTLGALGLAGGGDGGTFVQRYPVPGGHLAGFSPDRAPDAAGASQGTAPNVVAILRGTDPVLRDEYIVFSAHLDHIGVHANGTADSIWNGADDDASGVAGVLALAEAFTRAPTRRSLIFLLVSGEEKGLWGSDYFVSHPPVPVGQLVADLNLDMIGRNWRDTIVAIGREHSDLGATLGRVSGAHPELRMQAIDDLWPQENFYFRSDHYNFARRGVPVLFFFNGVHADYHQTSDSPDKVDAEKEARIVRLVYFVGRAVGEAPERPRWNPESYRKIVRP